MINMSIAEFFITLGGLVSIPTILTAVITSRINKKLDAQDKREEARRDQEHTGNVLIVKALRANGQYTDAIATAIVDGKVNGKMSHARESFAHISEELDNFLLDSAVTNYKGGK